MKKKLALPIIVEGKYDKIKLKSIFECTVISLDGFGVFKSKEKQLLIRRIAPEGIIVLTDSDGAGKVIRSFLNGIIPKDKIYNVYIPRIEGKERRKLSPSREGLIGVEGMSREVIEGLLSRFTEGEIKSHAPAPRITKTDFYLDGLSGADESAKRRDELALAFALPAGMSANALLEALNIATDREAYKKWLKERAF